MAGEPGGRECRPVRALFEEAERRTGSLEKSTVLDAALIDAYRKVKHYEIAGYSTACHLAGMLNQNDVFTLLSDTLEEETDAEINLEDLGEALLNGDTAAAGDSAERGA